MSGIRFGRSLIGGKGEVIVHRFRVDGVEPSAIIKLAFSFFELRATIVETAARSSVALFCDQDVGVWTFKF